MADDIYFSSVKNKKNTAQYTEKLDGAKAPQRQPSPSSSGASKGKGTSASGGKKKTNKKKKKKKIGIKAAVGIISGFVVLGLVVGLGISSVILKVLKNYNSNQMAENQYVDEAQLLSSDNVYNVLLMGIDTLNTSNSSRSDAMILLSVDSKHNKIKLTSFLRDTYVDIPGHGSAKLNAACVYGGPQLVCDTIEYNFGIKIDDYAKIGYDLFIEIIDAIGGVTIPEIDSVEAAALAKEGYSVTPGTNIKLDGYHALLYCRIRSGQNDFYRTTRQREVITQCIKQVMGTNPMTLIDVATNIASKTESSIDQSEFVPLGMKAVACIGTVEQFSVPADGTWYNDMINSQAVLVVDFSANKQKLNEFIYEQ